MGKSFQGKSVLHVILIYFTGVKLQTSFKLKCCLCNCCFPNKSGVLVTPAICSRAWELGKRASLMIHRTDLNFHICSPKREPYTQLVSRHIFFPTLETVLKE